MPKQRFQHQEPTYEWEQIRPKLIGRTQLTYESIHPMILWGETLRERSTETDVPVRTIYYKSNRFDQGGMASITSSSMKELCMTQTTIQPLEVLSSLGINGISTVVPVQGGFDMAMWKIEYADQSYALRVFRSGGHADCEREQVVMAAAHAAGLPVPEVYAAGVWQDHPVLLITWLSGRTIAEELRAQPWHLWHLGSEFGRMQAAIHEVPAPDLLRQRPDAWIVWKCEGEQAVQDRLHHLLLNKMALLHLDYHLNNVLTNGKQITGVLDWTHAHAGDPRADAARTVSFLRVDPAARKPLLLWLGLRIFELAWRIGYQRKAGYLKEMPLFYAWAGTVIQRDLAHRYQHMSQELTPARHWTNKWKARAGC